MPTSILMELLLSGGIRNECTHISLSFVTSAILRETVTRIKYLKRESRHRKNESSLHEPELDIDTLIALKLLFYVLELKIERLRLPHFTWRS
jgi:hypothetical protein